MRECCLRPVGVGHRERLAGLVTVDAGGEQRQRAVAARRQRDRLPGGADGVVGPDGAEVELALPNVTLAPSRLADSAKPSASSPPPKVVPSATIPVRLKLEERLTCVDVGRGVAVGYGLGFCPFIVRVSETYTCAAPCETLHAAAHRTYEVYVGGA